MKKVLSVLLSLVMAVTSLTMATGVFAADAKTAKVLVSAQMGGEFVSAPELLTVSSDLSDKYSSEVGFNDDGALTLLDVAIAAHIAFMGSDFMGFAPLTVGENGWITDFFGCGSGLGYYQNGVSAYSLTQAVSDGDTVDFDFYQDTDGYSDMYVAETTGKKAAIVNTATEFVFTASSWSGTVPAEGINVTIDGEKVATADKNGKVSLTFKTIGEHIVSSENMMGTTPVFMPYIKVKVSNNLSSYIDRQQAIASNKLAAKSYTVNETFDFIKLIRSGADVSKYKDAYVQSVKENLDANGGKLIVKNSNGELKENTALYGAVISILSDYGYATTDFYGYDIYEAFENADIEEARPHQYHYKYAIEMASPDRAKAMIDDLIKNYYTLGKGMDNYGYSCDNNCHFLITIAPYAEDYKEYVDDATKLIKSYLKTDGAYCDPVWSKNPNGDSTALSMAAFASLNDVKTAFSYYKLLVKNFEPSTGSFSFEANGDYNAYATGDVMFSLYYFRNAVYDNNFEHPEHVNIVTKGTPATFTAAGKTTGSFCKICGITTVRQTVIPKLGAAKIAKVKKGKRSFVVKWKKVANVDGYEIQYSTTKKFKKKVKGKKKVLKKITVKNVNTTKKKVKKLKSKKTYYVRIRAYKTINGVKQYSKWSKTKKVKVK